MVTDHDVSVDRPMFSLSGMTHEQFVAFARRTLERAGVQAEVVLATKPADEEDESLSQSVSVVTVRPYDAWRALTRQSDPVMERSGPCSITEQFYGVQVTIDAY